MGKVLLIITIFPTWTVPGFTKQGEMPDMERCVQVVERMKLDPSIGYAICVPKDGAPR